MTTMTTMTTMTGRTAWPRALSACLLLSAVPGTALPQEGGGPVNVEGVLFPRVEAGLEEAFVRGDHRVGSSMYYLDDFFVRGTVVGHLGVVAASMASGALAGAALGGPPGVAIGALGGALAGAAITIPAMMYWSPASVRSWRACFNNFERDLVCDLEAGSLYVLAVDFRFGFHDRERILGQCLLFFERGQGDAGNVLRWEVDRCASGAFMPDERFFAQDGEGALRTGGWTGWLLDWVQGHREVTARGAVDLDTGEALPDPGP